MHYVYLIKQYLLLVKICIIMFTIFFFKVINIAIILLLLQEKYLQKIKKIKKLNDL